MGELKSRGGELGGSCNHSFVHYRSNIVRTAREYTYIKVMLEHMLQSCIVDLLKHRYKQTKLCLNCA